MEEVIVFGDIEAGLVTLLRAQLADRSDTATVADNGYKPSSTTARPDRLVVVKRLGGAKQNIVTDGATIEFSCYDVTETAACALANLVRGIIGALHGDIAGDVYVRRTQEFAAPARMPHPASNNPRYVFTASVFYKGSAE